MQALFSLPFRVLEIPNIKITKPTWLKPPSPMEMISLLLMAHILIVGGVLFEVMTMETARFGTTTDKVGQRRVVAVMPKRINLEAMVSRLATSLVLSLLGVGFLVLDLKYNPSNVNKDLFISVAFLCILFSFFTTWLFNKIMYSPSYCVRCF